MGALAPIDKELARIFRPLQVETLADLFTEYAADRAGMGGIAASLAQERLVEHFVRANLHDRDRGMITVSRLGDLDGAIKALDAHYWQRALDLTDVLDAMPAARIKQWRDMVHGLETPPFEQGSVVSTLQALLAQRVDFFAERVDGIFGSLSRTHLTNRPEGFSKRMILTYVYTYGPDCDKANVIQDLRVVIAKLLGRESAARHLVYKVISHARLACVGQWVSLDGGAVRIKLFKNGNAHLEVHPEIAWKLNAILAHRHPNAIPAPHRSRPKVRAPKTWDLYDHPIAGPAIQLLHNGAARGRTFSFCYTDTSKLSDAAGREAQDVLSALGGRSEDRVDWTFDYDVHGVLQDVCMSGVIPDQRSHQFYPTPQALAETCHALLGSEEGHRVLEPSAGLGGLARGLSGDVTLVEVSVLHCTALRAQGFERVVCADFLQWRDGLFDRAILNPPFAGGRAIRHLEHAASMVRPGGRLVAILPEGLRGKDVLPGWSISWGDPVPFPGTSIRVCVLTADRV